MRRNLTKSEILRHKDEITRLFTTSPVPRSPSPVCISQPHFTQTQLAHLSAQPLRGSVQEAGLRLGFVVGPSAQSEPGGARDRFFVSPARRLGKAVRRNQAKRWQREFYRHSKELLCQLSAEALQAACHRVLRAPQASLGAMEPELMESIRDLESRLSYQWFAVIQREATESETRNNKAQALAWRRDFWPASWSEPGVDPAFGRELLRYERALAGLVKRLCQSWSDFLSATVVADSVNAE